MYQTSAPYPPFFHPVSKGACAYRDGVWHCWGQEVSKLAKEEAEYHDHFDEDAREVHQLEQWRNWYYHERLWRAVRAIPKGGLVLEIGAGSGFDAEKLMSDYSLVLSDISPQTLGRLRDRLGDTGIVYVAADGEQLPFVDGAFDGVYMVATLHHFRAPQHAVKEIWRVLKADGVAVIGIEPNAFYFRSIKRSRRWLCQAVHMEEHEGSHADAEMEGFTLRELRRLFPATEWGDVTVHPVWLSTGWVHYGLEFLFRMIRLKQRIRLPLWLEKIIVLTDELLFKLPGIRHLGWHWSVMARKRGPEMRV